MLQRIRRSCEESLNVRCLARRSRLNFPAFSQTHKLRQQLRMTWWLKTTSRATYSTPSSQGARITHHFSRPFRNKKCLASPFTFCSHNTKISQGATRRLKTQKNNFSCAQDVAILHQHLLRRHPYMSKHPQGNATSVTIALKRKRAPSSRLPQFAGPQDVAGSLRACDPRPLQAGAVRT